MKVVRSWSQLRRALKKLAYKMADVLPPDDDEVATQMSDDEGTLDLSVAKPEGDMYRTFDAAQTIAWLTDSDNMAALLEIVGFITCNAPELPLTTHIAAAQALTSAITAATQKVATVCHSMRPDEVCDICTGATLSAVAPVFQRHWFDYMEALDSLKTNEATT